MRANSGQSPRNFATCRIIAGSNPFAGPPVSAAAPNSMARMAAGRALEKLVICGPR